MNAVIYARFSSYGQNEQSIEGQVKDCYAFAQREGYKIVGEYIDRAKSARSDDRPDFQRMVKDAEKHQFEYILVWKLDRFARNRYDSAIYKARLKKHGVKVISVTENIGDNPEGIILEGMLESIAEYYSANLSVNIRRGQRETISKGMFTGGAIPYGYKSENGRLVANERTAPIIKYVYEQYADGVTMRRILDALDAQGVKSPRGKKLSPSSFEKALTNTVYIGKLTRNGEVVEGCADQIIDDDLFNRVQARRKTVKRSPAATKAKVVYQLQGKAFCGLCGATIVGESGRGRSGVYNYYACSARKKHKTCDKANEKKGFVEWYVVEQTLLYVLAPERIDTIAEAVVNQYDADFNDSKISDVEKNLSRLDADLNILVDTLLDVPKSARARVYEKMETLEAQKIELETDLAKLRIANNIRYTAQEVKAWMQKFCNGDPLDADFQRRILDVFVNTIYLYDDKVVVFYNIKDGRQTSCVGLCDSLDDSDLTANGGA